MRMFREGDKLSRYGAADHLARFLKLHHERLNCEHEWRLVFLTMRPTHESQLLKWLRSDNEELVAPAAYAFGCMGLARARRPLAERATPEVSEKLARVLFTAVGQIGRGDSVQLLLNRADGSRYSGAVKTGLAWCLHDTEDDSDFLTWAQRLMKDKESHIRALAFRAAGLRADQRLTKRVSAALDDEDVVVRGSAALALSRLEGADVEDTVTRAHAEAAEPFEQLSTALAVLQATGQVALVDELSIALVDHHDLVLRDPALLADCITVLRDAGGNKGAELADTVQWLYEQGY